VDRARLLELLLLWSLMVALGVYAFPQGIHGDLGFHLTPILLLPFPLWAAARFEVRGAALTVAIIAAMAVAFMVRGIHPYSGFSPQLAVWLMQEYLAIVAVTSIGLAILLHEIERQKAGLERRVRERTAELQRSNEALAEANQQLQELASTDYLTGIANRRYFYDIAGRTMERMASENNPVSLLIFDLDHFKSINDRFGHDVGDEVLSTTVKAAQGAIRPLDLFARFGGEEFVIMLFGANEENAVMVAERLRRAIAAQRLEHQGEQIRPTVSIGVSQWDGDESIDALIHKADKALYRAKSQGRNCVRVASGG
jgi:diguanylate cyclase (GGDEF)-like protein